MAKDAIKQTGQIIFSGQDIRVRLVPGGSHTLVVTFPASSARNRLDREGFAEALLAKENIAAAHVTVSFDHWFQTHETDQALAAIREHARGFERVVTYGSSMGGYAAAVCSKALGAAAIISISPQFSIDPAKAPWDPRYVSHAKRILAGPGFLRDEMSELLCPDAEFHITYDPVMTSEQLHAKSLLTFSANSMPLVIPFGGHPVGKTLAKAGLLKPWVLAAIHGKSAGDIRNKFREMRRNNALWWTRLAILASRRRPALSTFAAQTALRLAPQDKGVAFAVAMPLRRAGLMEEALSACDTACRLAPRSGKFRVERGRTLLQMRRLSDAMADFEKARDLGETRLALPALSELHARMGRHAEARAMAQDAVLVGVNPSIHDRIEKLLAAAERQSIRDQQ